MVRRLEEILGLFRIQRRQMGAMVRHLRKTDLNMSRLIIPVDLYHSSYLAEVARLINKGLCLDLAREQAAEVMARAFQPAEGVVAREADKDDDDARLGITD